MSTVDVQPLQEIGDSNISGLSNLADSSRKSAGSAGSVVAKSELSKLPLQETSLDIWDKKYRLKTKDSENVDQTITDTIHRVARALADVEKNENDRSYWYARFVWALEQGAIPAGRIISNAGALAHKPATSTINCTVSGTINDSMDDILAKVHEAG